MQQQQKPQQWFLIERNHYVIIAIMIFISSTDAHDAMNEVGKRHLAFATTIKVVKMRK